MPEGTYYQRFRREGRVTIFCCKQFNRVDFHKARRLVRAYKAKTRMKPTGNLMKGKCPSEDGRCR
jgi:hypothetical protein